MTRHALGNGWETGSSCGAHLTFPELITEISPDVVGATSTIGKFRLPLGS